MGETPGPPPTTEDTPRPTWPVFRGADRLAPAIALTVVGLLAASRLPPGICYGDSGDLQLACTTLGIPHPPGYAGYVTLGYLATRFPGVDPAYLVSVACLGSGLITLLLCVLTQVRLGVNPWAASAVGVGLAGHTLVWSNLIAPEVYMPSLAFLAAAAYLLVKHARLGRRRDLCVAAILFGVAMFNRPPVLLAAPFFLAGWWLARGARETSWRRSIQSFSLAAGCAVLPAVYSLAYFLWRDSPRTAYNYIEEYNAESENLPDGGAGLQAKLERAVWLATGRQYGDQVGNTWPGVRAKLRWVRQKLGPDSPLAFFMGLSLLMCGAVIVGRRCRVSAWLLSGMAAHCLVFVCAYRIHGQAADLTPLLFAAAVFGGVALSPLLPVAGGRGRRLVAIGLFAVVSIGFGVAGPHRRSRDQGRDATGFVETVDMPTFPERAVIFAGWEEALPLRYAALVLSDRRDIRIVTAHPAHWLGMAEGSGDRPVFVTARHEGLKGHTLTPFRSLWRLD